MRSIALLTALFWLAGCATVEEPLVIRNWELQKDGHYIFESNNPANIGMVSYKGWSGYHRDARLIALEYTAHAGGRGLVYGLVVELDGAEDLPVLAVDHRGRFNLLDPRTHRPLREEWEPAPSYRRGAPLLLEAKRREEGWRYDIAGQEVASFPVSPADARYKAVLYTTYGPDRRRSDFPKKKILVELNVLRED